MPVPCSILAARPCVVKNCTHRECTMKMRKVGTLGNNLVLARLSLVLKYPFRKEALWYKAASLAFNCECSVGGAARAALLKLSGPLRE